MTRTRPLHLVLLALGGIAAGWLLEVLLVSTGRAVAVPPYTLAITLLAIAVLVVLLALPVRRVAQGRPGAKVDPFYATRVVVLAKAASITAAALSGAMLAILVFLVTRPVIGSALWPAILGAVASAALLAAGVIAENMCRLPPPPDDDELAVETPGEGPEH